jgi:hypothetical protein
MKRSEFDCHGLNYLEVEDKLPNWLLINQFNLPIDIITGASDKMKQVVKEILDKYEFKYHVPIHNSGMITIYK